MSLKEEIEKLIQTERQRLVQSDKASEDHDKRQHKRFQPLRAVLAELAQSVDSRFLKVTDQESRMIFELGATVENGRFDREQRWIIAANSKISFSGTSVLFLEQPGYLVEQTSYYRYPEADQHEEKLVFADEQGVVQHLVGIIGQKVAYYLHRIEERSKRQVGSQSS